MNPTYLCLAVTILQELSGLGRHGLGPALTVWWVLRLLGCNCRVPLAQWIPLMQGSPCR